MSQEITQELANEYREVAALVCSDLDCLAIAASRSDMTLEKLRDQISLVVQMKDEITTKSDVRRSRYAAASLLFSLPVRE